MWNWVDSKEFKALRILIADTFRTARYTIKIKMEIQYESVLGVVHEGVSGSPAVLHRITNRNTLKIQCHKNTTRNTTRNATINTTRNVYWEL